jgi:hypothetical protein
MKQLYDELDSEGNIVYSNILLIPGLNLPTGHRWVEHVQTLEEAKHDKRTEIESIKAIKCFEPVDALGHTWQADARSQSLISSAVLLAQIGAAPSPTSWRTLDNIDVAITLADLKTIAGTIAYYTQQAYTQSWQLKALTNAATTIPEVNNILWL